MPLVGWERQSRQTLLEASPPSVRRNKPKKAETGFQSSKASCASCRKPYLLLLQRIPRQNSVACQGAIVVGSRDIFNVTVLIRVMLCRTYNASAVGRRDTSSDSVLFLGRLRDACRPLACTVVSKVIGWRSASATRVAHPRAPDQRRRSTGHNSMQAGLRKTEAGRCPGAGSDPFQSGSTYSISCQGHSSRYPDMGVGGHRCRLEHDAKRLLRRTPSSENPRARIVYEDSRRSGRNLPADSGCPGKPSTVY